MGDESFAQLLRRHRIAAGLSQEKLAERAGVSVDAISALERGTRHAPYKATLDLLIAALALDDDARREIEEAAKLARARGPLAQRHEFLRNLPLQLTSFVDREKVLTEIKELLPTHRFVTLVGTGGAGKTRCAIKVASEIRNEFDDGVWLAELAPICDPSLVAGVIARTLSLQETPNRRMLDTLVASLKRKRLLLVLDNCEHVIERARYVVATILHSCPGVHILATSRECFTIAGEHVYHMPPLPVPSTTELLSTDEMSQYGAVQLFTDRAVSADSRFILTVENVPHVAEICRRLDGIPLAIELAAARVKTLSPEQLAQRLDERFRLLTIGDHTALPRHRTMRALIDWSYDLLSDDECRLFRKLSIFAGDFTLELAAAVCGDSNVDEIAVLDLLSSLVDKSLVQTEPAPNARRYRLLESTREYAREKLTEAGEYNGCAREHARAFCALAEHLRDAWETTPDCEWLGRVKPELENFRAALEWALGARGDVVLGQRLAGALYGVWRFFPMLGRRWVKAAQRLVDTKTPTSVIAALDLSEAQIANIYLDFKTAYASAERALSKYCALGNPPPLGIVEAKRFVGNALVGLGKIGEGEASLHEAVAEARALGALKSMSSALVVLGMSRTNSSDVVAARQFFGESLMTARAAGAERLAAITALALAETEFSVGNASAALRLVREALTVLRTLHDTRSIVNARRNETAYLVSLCRYDEARIAARDALATAFDMEYSVDLAFALQHLAAIAALRPNADAPVIEDRCRAARILGYANARISSLEALREHTEQNEYDRIIRALRDVFGADEPPRRMAEGSTWSESQAVAEAMLI